MYIRFKIFPYISENHIKNIALKTIGGLMSKGNFDFWREVWEKYPHSQIVYATEMGKVRQTYFIELLGKRKGLTLDLGCGDGHLRPFILEFVGLDVSRDALSKIDGDVALGVGEVLPFRDEVFNRVVISETFEHLTDRSKCLRETRRVLKPSGELIIATPYGFDPNRLTSSKRLKKYGVHERLYPDGRFNEPLMRGLLNDFGFLTAFSKVLYVKKVPSNLIVIAIKRA